MIENDYTRKKLADELGIALVTLQRKLSLGNFKKTEIEVMKNIFKVDSTDIFFTDISSC